MLPDFDDGLRLEIMNEILIVSHDDVIQLSLNVDAMSGRQNPLVRYFVVIDERISIFRE